MITIALTDVLTWIVAVSVAVVTGHGWGVSIIAGNVAVIAWNLMLAAWYYGRMWPL